MAENSSDRADPPTAGVHGRRVGVPSLAALWSWILGVAWLVAGCGDPPAPPKNLVFVTVDTLRADHVGHLGYERRTSPRLDAAAGEGVAFTRHHAHASRTGPSVASLFTGLHPRSHGVVNPLGREGALGLLDESQTTLAEVLRGAGFRSAGFIANVNISGRFGFAQGFEVYEAIETGLAEDLNRAAFDWLDRQQGSFFLYLHYIEPHSSYRAAPRHRYRFIDPAYEGPADGTTDQLQSIMKGRWRPAAADVAHIEALYDQEVVSFDDALGSLVDGLISRELLDSSVLVVVADHGEEFLDHRSAGHGVTLYQEQLWVPLVIRDPRFGSGRRVAASTRNTDLFPTLLELLGIEPSVPVQGVSLVPLMRGESRQDPDPPLFAELSVHFVRDIKRRSFTYDGWKLIDTLLPQPRLELYRLSVDPRETRDLAERRPRVLARMRAELASFAESLPVSSGGTIALSPLELDRLVELGYLEGAPRVEPLGELAPSKGSNEAAAGVQPTREAPR